MDNEEFDHLRRNDFLYLAVLLDIFNEERVQSTFFKYLVYITLLSRVAQTEPENIYENLMSPQSNVYLLPYRLHSVQSTEHEPLPWKGLEIRQFVHKKLEIRRILTCARLEMNSSYQSHHRSPPLYKWFTWLWRSWWYDLYIILDYLNRTFVQNQIIRTES